MTDDSKSTSTSSERGTELETCTACERPIETSEWHPMVSDRDDDGEFHVYAFCDETCRDAWCSE